MSQLRVSPNIRMSEALRRKRRHSWQSASQQDEQRQMEEKEEAMGGGVQDVALTQKEMEKLEGKVDPMKEKHKGLLIEIEIDDEKKLPIKKALSKKAEA